MNRDDQFVEFKLIESEAIINRLIKKKELRAHKKIAHSVQGREDSEKILSFPLYYSDSPWSE
jgi:hypothetical protein